MIDVSATLVTLKAIAGVAKDAGRIDLYSEILSLQQTLLEAIADNMSKVQENSLLTLEVVGLRAQVATLQRALAQRDEMVFESNVYWRIRDPGKKEGPYCPKCLDGDGKTSRMSDTPGDTCWRCLVCTTAVLKPGASFRRHGRIESDWDPLGQ